MPFSGSSPLPKVSYNEKTSSVSPAIKNVQAGLLRRLPPAEGIADVDMHILWNREQHMSRAETVFIEGLVACDSGQANQAS
ncbi:hypothetical protein AX279_06130 [Pseudomonas sp. J237]|nr:hypothetical protein AX279_06130 [Pseudomonas sp. J237]